MRVQNKKGAIELSIGTIVIIVLAMSMLILGLVLIRTIFTGATGAVSQIDSGVKNEINKLFAENNQRKVVLYPDSGIIELKQGATGEGFAISIRNTETGSADKSKFGYQVIIADDPTQIYQNCKVTNADADPTISWAKIDTGRQILAQSTAGIPLSAGQAMQTPIHVRFSVRGDAPVCTFRLAVNVFKNSNSPDNAYDTAYMDVKIVPA